MKKIIKVLSIALFLVFFVNEANSTNVTIYVAGHQQWVQQNNNTLELYCVPPYDITCIAIVINDQGTYVIFDTGGNNPGIQVEDNYIEETDENGNKHFVFHPVN